MCSTSARVRRRRGDECSSQWLPSSVPRASVTTSFLSMEVARRVVLGPSRPRDGEARTQGHRFGTAQRRSERNLLDLQDVVVRAMEVEPAGAVLVAHSMAGLSVPIAASRLPVRALVFMCGLIAAPGRSWWINFRINPTCSSQAMAADSASPTMNEGVNGWILSGADNSLRRLRRRAGARAAFDRLRPQAEDTYFEPCPLVGLPDIEYAYIMGSEDGLVNPEWSREAAATRLGVQPIELPGGHSPFLARQGALAEILHQYA